MHQQQGDACAVIVLTREDLKLVTETINVLRFSAPACRKYFSSEKRKAVADILERLAPKTMNKNRALERDTDGDRSVAWRNFDKLSDASAVVFENLPQELVTEDGDAVQVRIQCPTENWSKAQEEFARWKQRKQSE